MKQIFNTYIKRPFLILISNPALLFFSFVLIVFNSYTSKIIQFFVHVTPKQTIDWLCFTLPNIVSSFSFVQYLQIIGVFLIINLSAAILSVIVSKNMIDIFRGDFKGMKFTFVGVKKDFFYFFILFESIVHFFYFGFIVLIYFLVYDVYINYNINLIYLFIFAFLFYPLFYMGLSYSAFLSVLPISFKQKIEKFMFVFTNFKIIFQLYAFYAIRLSLEGVLVFIIPLIIGKLNLFPELIPISIAIGLMVPFALFRNSGIEIKLNILQKDIEIRYLFEKHYSKYYNVNQSK